MKIDSDALKRLMIEKQMTLKELSQATGLSTITLAAMLKDNQTRHQYKTIGSLIRGLGVKVDDVLSADEN